MGRIANRIARGLAAVTVVIIPTTLLMATPAHAAAETNWTIDRDHVVLGASSTNSFKAFDGEVRSWYDGPNVRGTLTGPFIGRGTLKVTWTFHDGSTASSSDYTAGVQHNINFNSPAGKSVVRFTFTYTPNSGSVDTQTNYVGDSPDSVGSCTRLDQDGFNIPQGDHGKFIGSVYYGCTSDGHVYAEPAGTTTWSGDSAVTMRAEFVIWYTDGSVEVRTTPIVSSSRTTATVGAMSDQTKNVTWVNVRMHRWVNGTSDSTMPQQASKFGEDV
jgi:hypothetical protein